MTYENFDNLQMDIDTCMGATSSDKEKFSAEEVAELAN